jgi:uncharacterized spore protein YtfJ
MVDFAALRSDTTALLGAPVTAAGVFVIDIGRVAPAAGGTAGALAADAATSMLGIADPITDGLAAGAASGAARHAVYEGAASAAGVTPVMVLAVTDADIVLLDWHGDVRSGTGPTEVFARFARDAATVTSTRSGPTRHIVLTQGEVTARVQCTLGLLSPGKSEIHAVLAELGID